MIFKKLENSWNINRSHFAFLLVICLFVLSEYCPMFYIVDRIHLKHIAVALIILLYYLKKQKFVLGYELKLCFGMVGILYGITIIKQIIAAQFEMYSIAEVYYLVIPIIFVQILYDLNRSSNMDDIMTAVLYCGLLSFFAGRIVSGTLSWHNFIRMFNFSQLFIESESPMIESGLSSCFVLLYIYFLYRRKKIRAFLSAFGTFLGFKRIPVLYMILLTIFHGFIPRNKKVPKYLVILMMVAFTALPFLAEMLCSDEFARWFYNQFGINFNKFTMTRFYLINLVIDADLPELGLGTVTDFLTTHEMAGLNMHNDILRIYLECGILGSIALSVAYFKMTAYHWYGFLTILFMMLQMFVTHCLGSGTVLPWILVYIIVFFANRADDDSASMEIKV